MVTDAIRIMKKIILILYIFIIKQTILSQVWLHNLVPKNTMFQKMIDVVDEVGPIDSTYWNCYCLNFYKMREDTLCMAYKENRYDIWCSPQNEYIGYIKSNDTQILVHGKEALSYTEVDTEGEYFILHPSKTPSFIEWVGTWPNFLIRNGIPYQIIEINKEYQIYKEAIDRVLKDCELQNEAISIDFDHYHGIDTMQMYNSSYNLITRFEMYPQLELDIKSLSTFGETEKNKKIVNLFLRPIRHGVFSISLRKPSFVIHYYYYVSCFMKPIFFRREILELERFSFNSRG